MSRTLIAAAMAGFLFSTGAADALPLSLPLPAHPLSSSTPSLSVIVNTIGAVQAVLDPVPAVAGGILSPLVSVSEADLGHVFVTMTGGGDPLCPDDLFDIDPALHLDASLVTVTSLASDLLGGADPDALLRLTSGALLSAELGLSGLGPLPDINLGVDPLALCLSLALGGNATNCLAAAGPGPNPGATGVPESGSLALLGAGLAGLSLVFGRRRMLA